MSPEVRYPSNALVALCPVLDYHQEVRGSRVVQSSGRPNGDATTMIPSACLDRRDQGNRIGAEGQGVQS